MNKLKIKKDDTVIVITGKDEGKRHPTVCDNVLIGTGCKVFTSRIITRLYTGT